ncbi:EAL domain-containing protein [Ferrovibrio sp. MS7]|uniref:EAL domain-containing protein n=1 Tax=Ferrovibrio plantarum TaxID=3119164 RepID=UPI003135BE7E
MISIRSYMVMMVGALVALVALLRFYGAYSEYKVAIAERGQTLAFAAESAALRVESFISDTEIALSAVADNEAVAALDPTRCRDVFDNSLRFATQFNNMVTVDRRGRVICSAAPIPVGESRHVNPHFYLSRLLDHSAFTVGGLNPQGAVTGAPHISLAYPIGPAYPDDLAAALGLVAGAISFSLDPHRLPLLLPALPEAVAYAVGPDRIVVLASPDAQEAIGTALSPGLDFEPAARVSSWHEDIDDPDHQPYIIAQSHQLINAGWTILVVQRRDAALAQARTALLHHVVIDALVMLALLGIVGTFSRKLYDPMAALARIMDRIRDGATVSQVQVEGPREVQQIATATNRMLAALGQRQEELRQSQERLTLAFVGNQDGIWDWHIPSGCVIYSDRLVAMLGYAIGELSPQISVWRELVHPDDRDAALANLRRHVSGDAATYESEYRRLMKDGRYKWVLDRGAVVERDATGFPIRAVGTCSDIDARKLAEERLVQAGVVFEKSPQAIMVTDVDNIIRHVNPAFERLTGYHAEEVIGHRPALLSSGRQNREFYVDMWAAIDRDGEWGGEVWNRRKDGSIYCEWLSVSQMRQGEALTGYIGMFVDITDRKNAEAQIRWQADYDPLTRLPNRRLVLDRIDRAARQALRDDSDGGAVLLLDLDHFKEVNDTLGHLAGDALLLEVAHRLQVALRDTDTVARLGGDEFVILLPNLTPEAVPEVIDKLNRQLAAPFVLEGRELQISSSIGVTFFPADAADPTDLLRMADTAMYAAKKAERGTWRFFDTSMQTNAEHRLALLADLRRAMAQNEFELFYQPIMKLQDTGVGKAEALLRWRHPQRGLVVPGDFISLLEESGLIHEVGFWVIQKALQHRAELLRAGIDIEIAVNVSTKQFERDDFVPRVVRLLAQYEMALPITLEVTESMALSDAREACAKLEQLVRAGASIALDDFGTGYSSLSYLTALPVATLKIDRSFLVGAETDPAVARLVRAIIDLGHDLGLSVVAEGIETQAQADALRAMHCDLGQGFMFGKPLAFSDFIQRYASCPEPA